MATRHSSGRALIAAAGYLRRSTEKQEQSIADQRREIERYAAQHGYTINRWFEDNGISGDDTKRRRGFQELHRAACDPRRDFRTILVWDQDRFGRFNSMEAGYWIHPLMEAGVGLVTVTEGPINWHDFSGRMIYSMKQEGKHQFLRDLSRNTARGQITSASQGHITGRAAPYGYDRMLVDERGEPKQRVRNGEKVAKPRGWRVTLVPSDDPTKVETLRWIFREYASRDVGLRQMADMLNSRGVKPPNFNQTERKGKKPAWLMSTIREMLKNPAYTGSACWARRRLGKYHRVSGNEILPREMGGPRVALNDKSSWIVCADAFEALIDQKTFDRVQAKLGERRQRTTPYKTSHGADRFLLSGLVFCGHCGRKMHGASTSRTKKGKSYSYPKYRCSTYALMGSVPGCGCHSVHEKPLVDFVLAKMREAILAGGHLDELRERIKARLAAQRAEAPNQASALRAKLVDLDGQLESGARRLVRCPDNIADLLAGELSTMRVERDRVAAELASLEAAGQASDLDELADRKARALWTLGQELGSADPARLREILRSVVDRIELHFGRIEKGTRVECPFSHGIIRLRPDPIMLGPEHRGEKTPIELFLASFADWSNRVRRLL
jgi:DNA invertase Pin-like site-specific DNA recombinase